LPILDSVALKIDFMLKNLLLISIVVFAAILLIFFLIKENQKDKKTLVKTLNNDYQQPKVNEPEI